jgi:hypothetical protein
MHRSIERGHDALGMFALEEVAPDGDSFRAGLHRRMHIF